MLKRISVLTLLLLYFVTASGFALNLHYCGNIVSSVKIDAPAEKCSLVKMKCCHDLHLDVKVKDAHQAQANFAFAKLFVADLPNIAYAGYLLAVQQLTITTPTDRGPPDRSPGTPIYLKNQVFRI
jgi:hypothetical protein